MGKTPTRTLAIIAPLLLIGTLQLSGCVRRGPDVAPPGGVYRSTSGGAQFDQSVPLIDGAGELIGNIAETTLRNIHRVEQSPNIIFITAGAQGAFVSEDDGQSWRQLNQPLAAATGIVRLQNEILLIAGTNADGEGIVARSLNNGVSWDEVLTIPAFHSQKKQFIQVIKPPPPPAVFISSISLNPFQPEQVYATTSTGDVLVGEQSGKVWRSLSRVAGEKRNPITNRLIASIRSIVPSPHREGELLLITTDGDLVRLRGDEAEELKMPTGNLTVVDVSYVRQFPDAIFVGTTKGTFISRNAGVDFDELDLPVSTAAAVRNTVVRTSPTNATRLLIAIDSILYRSEDGGKNFVTHSLELPNHIITDINIDPTNASRVLLTTTPAQS